MSSGLSSRSSAWLAGGGLAAGAASLAGASCCALPLLLINLGIGGAVFSFLPVMAQTKPWLIIAGAALALGGLALAFRNGRPRGRTVFLALAAIIFVIAALAMPFYEAVLLRALQ